MKPLSRKATAARTVVMLVGGIVTLGIVAWRQSTAHETMLALEDVARQTTVAADERAELARQLVRLEARSWIGAEASRRLDLRAPTESEVIIPAGYTGR